VKVLFGRFTIWTIIDWYNKDFEKSAILMAKMNFLKFWRVLDINLPISRNHFQRLFPVLYMNNNT
jgi:hypothetical protein